MPAAPLIAASILSANCARLGDDVSRVVPAGTAMMDVHLMVEPVDALVPMFAKAGAGLDHVMDKLDLLMLMLMSVNPGFGGQSFIASTLPKLTQVRRRLDAYAAQSGRHIRLEVDGGVKPDNIAEIARAGADTFVAGSAVFGSADWAATIAALKAGARSGAADRRPA
jgi:ribulose-phosphate 3-epimerase